MDLTLVTSNRGKVREIREILRPYGIQVRVSSRTLPEPQADRLETVVEGKLAALRGLRGWVVVEDSGLFIPSLRGFPGVYSAFVFRTLGPQRVADLLRGRSRAAVFRTVAGLRHGRRRWVFDGETRGSIAWRTRGTAGFGFDSIFIPVGSRRTFAELELVEKNRVSHRARAITRLARHLTRERNR